jgi:hypothetical protein
MSETMGVRRGDTLLIAALPYDSPMPLGPTFSGLSEHRAGS